MRLRWLSVSVAFGGLTACGGGGDDPPVSQALLSTATPPGSNLSLVTYSCPAGASPGCVLSFDVQVLNRSAGSTTRIVVYKNVADAQSGIISRAVEEHSNNADSTFRVQFINPVPPQGSVVLSLMGGGQVVLSRFTTTVGGAQIPTTITESGGCTAIPWLNCKG